MVGFIDFSDNSLPAGGAVGAGRRSGDTLRVAQQAQIRAKVMREPENPKVERALTRLDRILGSNQQPRAEVPRGFYINIEV